MQKLCVKKIYQMWHSLDNWENDETLDMNKKAIVENKVLALETELIIFNLTMDWIT
jgi:hypothetical protein